MKKNSQIKAGPSKKNQIINWVLIVFFTLFAGAIRFYHLGSLSLWNDEIFSYNAASGNLSDVFKRDQNMSLFHYIAHFYILILPRISEFTLRILPALFSTISVPVFFLFCNKLFEKNKHSLVLSFIATSLFSINAYNIQYAQDFRGYGLAVLLVIASTFIFIKAVEKSLKYPDLTNIYWIVYVVLGAASIYTHFFAIFILLAHFVSLFALQRKDDEPLPYDEIIKAYLLIGILILPIINTILAKGGGQIGWIAKPTQKELLAFFVKITGNQGPQLLITYLVAISTGVLLKVINWKNEEISNKWKFHLTLHCALLPILISFLYSLIKTPIFLDRYLLIISPFLSILVSIGVVGIFELRQKLDYIKILLIITSITILAIILFNSSIGIKKYYENYKKEDWKNTAKLVETLCSDEQTVRLYYPIYMEPNVRYYNKNLKSQVSDWGAILKVTTTSADLATKIPETFKSGCLISGSYGGQKKEVRKMIEQALEIKFGKDKKSKFYETEVQVYVR